ncbi:uncharacterized protein LOC123550656 [Mercenaria mercenaria]|uniref:uncharacterized protein LOC123550656 n=1 Tax=Mercenaria mercenaria TaxID=6596 RepID=UPI00234EF2D0|nr:uncharacterized protein LOC123550656 [Mercenaria mercenaria]
MNRAAANLLSSFMTKSRQQAMETFVVYKRRGLIRRAQNLIENIDNVVTCINLDRGRDPSLFKSSMSALSKLNLWENEIREATNDKDMPDIISAARFLLENQGLLMDEIDNSDRVKRQLLPTDIAIDSDEEEEEDDDDLPDIFGPTLMRAPTCTLKSKSPVKGIKGLHKLKPYSRPTSTVTSASSTSSTLSETVWEKRENEMLVAHQRELSKAKQEARDELLLCIICLSAEKDHTLVPCGHTFCKDCSRKSKANGKCFFCMAKVNSCVKMRLTD